MRPVTTRIPEEDERLLEELVDEAGADRSEVLRRLIGDGLDAWRRDRALDALADNRVTVRRAAEMAGVTPVEMLSLAADREIEIGYDEAELERDVERFS